MRSFRYLRQKNGLHPAPKKYEFLSISFCTRKLFWFKESRKWRWREIDVNVLIFESVVVGKQKMDLYRRCPKQGSFGTTEACRFEVLVNRWPCLKREKHFALSASKIKVADIIFERLSAQHTLVMLTKSAMKAWLLSVIVQQRCYVRITQFREPMLPCCRACRKYLIVKSNKMWMEVFVVQCVFALAICTGTW